MNTKYVVFNAVLKTIDFACTPDYNMVMIVRKKKTLKTAGCALRGFFKAGSAWSSGEHLDRNI